MNLATLKRTGPDGALVVVSDDRRRAVAAPDGVGTLQAALDDWDASEPRLRDAAWRLDDDGFALQSGALDAPLPRAYQWADASTYLAHMERLRAARGAPLPPEHRTDPIVFNAGSDRFLGPTDPIPLGDEGWGLDLEATIAVVTGDVPAGTNAEEAPAHVRLVLLANDLTLRHLLPAEAAKGVGFFQCKPARSFAPVAVTPDGLGEAWDGALLHATVECSVNGDALGALDSARDCAFDFGAVIAHMTMTRSLAAGTIVGSGTVSNRDPAAGFGCLAEKRALESTASGQPATPYLRTGDRVRIEAFDRSGRSLFGAIDQTVAAPTTTERAPRTSR
jgi:fumarylacetoacetate (FAA) hydrolase